MVIQIRIHIQTLCLSLRKLTRFFIPNHHYHENPLSCTKELILFMLDAGHSAHSIASITDVHTFTISRLYSKEHSELHKSFDGRLTKLSPINICHAVHLITIKKAENAVQVTKSLKNIINQSLFTTTV